MDVTWWVFDESPPPGGGFSGDARWNCSLDSDPSINATGRSMANMQQIFVNRYNDLRDANTSAGDFTWNETSPPEPGATVDPV